MSRSQGKATAPLSGSTAADARPLWGKQAVTGVGFMNCYAVVWLTAFVIIISCHQCAHSVQSAARSLIFSCERTLLI